MQTSPRDFFVVGGTLQPDAPSYIERQADRELFDRVLAGDFCYVLTPRQMGKSSLMAHTAKRLQEQGVRTAIVDLTQIGTEKEKQSAEQWYFGVAHRILRELGLKVNLNAWWQERWNLPALQRLTEFYHDLVLEKSAERVVIFVDEIDTTIALPFADDFFAAIRACYNARATEPAYQRLSLVLLGVAGPSDLMKDPQRTPFNIGHRIDLTDFTFEEAKPLAQGLGRNETRCEQALRRILFWTNGHPYLTQKLCAAVLEEKLDDCSDGELDRLVDRRFLSAQAHCDDSNLNFVRDRLLEDKARRRPMLKLYRRIRSGKQVPDDPRSPVHAMLKLSGLVAPAVDRLLMVRNRIYERVFTPQWAKAAMPVDLNRRIALASSLAVLMLGFGFWYTQFLPKPYIEELRTARVDVPILAHEKLRRIPGFRVTADDLLAEYWERRALRAEAEEGRDAALLSRLQAHAIRATDRRSQEVSRLLNPDYENLLATYRHSYGIEVVAFSPDGKTVLTGSGDNTARLWRAESGQPIGQPMQHQDDVTAVAFSPDGKTVLTGSGDKMARLWRAESGQPIGQPMQHQENVVAVAFSPDGKTVLTGGGDNTARLWRVESGQPIGQPMQHQSIVTAVAFSPDGKTVLTGSEDGTAQLWRAESGQPIGQPMQHQDYVYAVAFSPDGKTVLTGSNDGTARLWRAESGQPIGQPMQHRFYVAAVAFSPDGKTLMAATSRWVHLASVVADTLTPAPKASRMLAGSWTNAYRFLDASGNQMQVAVRTTGNAIQIDTLRFDIPNAPALKADPKTLLEEWKKKLALQFDENGKIVPMWSDSTPPEAPKGLRAFQKKN